MRKLKLNAGWITVILLSIIPIIFWSLTPKIDSLFVNVQNTIISLGEIFGLVGIVIFSLNFILATRLSFIEKLFDGLNNVYKKHNLLGQLAFILLLFHPLFLLPRYASNLKEGASFLFLSNLWPRNFGIIALWTIIFLIVLTLYIRPKYNIWKITHKFFGVALFFGALHAFLIPSYIMNNLLLKSYVLIFAVLGILAFLYKSVFGKYLMRTYKYVVGDIKYLNNEIIEIALKPENKRLQFNSGQFVFVSFDQESLSESHPFSISSGPNEDLLKITVKRLGVYTKTLIDKLKKSTIAKIEGPYGTFSYNQAQNKNQIWIAGGISITPFISFTKDIINKGIKDMNIKLFYCIKNDKEAIYLDSLKKIATLKFISIIPFFSEDKGHISIEYIKEHITNFNDNDFFICAPPKMIQELRKNLINKGVSRSKIYSEEFDL